MSGYAQHTREGNIIKYCMPSIKTIILHNTVQVFLIYTIQWGHDIIIYSPRYCYTVLFKLRRIS